MPDAVESETPDLAGGLSHAIEVAHDLSAKLLWGRVRQASNDCQDGSGFDHLLLRVVQVGRVELWKRAQARSRSFGGLLGLFQQVFRFVELVSVDVANAPRRELSELSAMAQRSFARFVHSLRSLFEFKYGLIPRVHCRDSTRVPCGEGLRGAIRR